MDRRARAVSRAAVAIRKARSAAIEGGLPSGRPGSAITSTSAWCAIAAAISRL